MKHKLIALSAAGALAVGMAVAIGLPAAQAAPAAAPPQPAVHAAPPPPAVHGLGTMKFLPLAKAQRAAEVALAACAKRGFPVAATVVDRDGVTIVALRADGAPGATIAVTKGKATAAAGFQSPTSALQEAAKTNPGLISLPDFVILPGGLPIKGAGAVVAGIGVGGAPSGLIDEACAAAGIRAIS